MGENFRCDPLLLIFGESAPRAGDRGKVLAQAEH
jgi:hypothetical protein